MKRTRINYLGLLGIISLLSYTAAVIFAPLAYPNYDWLSMAVSDLSAETAPSRVLWNQLSALYMPCGIVCLCVMMTGCHAASKFDGNKTVNEDCFQMDYSILNQSEDATLSLTAGDTLQVEIAQESGTVSVCVSMDGKEPIYTGSDLSNAFFTLNITETGCYRISVTGRKACGSVAFIKTTRSDGKCSVYIVH